MRIAQIMLAKGFGGAERSFVDLCMRLAARGHEVLAILEPRGVAARLLTAHAHLTRGEVRVLGSWDPLARRAIGRALAAFAPDVVQCHLARAAHLGGAAARGLGLPVLAKTHNYVDLKYYTALDRLVPTTRDQFDYLRTHGIAEVRLALIPNFSAIEAVASPPVPANDPPILAAAGRFVAKKGFDVLLRAIARLDEPLRLRLAGSGPEEAALRALAESLGIASRVEFMGWVDDVRSVLDGADLFVLPSHDEPFGIVVLEAMALGVPLVSTMTAGPREILDAATALLVPIGDVDALAAAIASTLAAPGAARARAAVALDRFRERYSAGAVVARYEALYAELVRR
ncbi:MAG: glycosyltransferase [Gammaproteobacteria bacterium]|nr:glycosyltransferase [Gammaproteobacteria bacterium]MBI5616328.1 glycosyltransferase [Gammaproteobacteria bacterium]